MLDNEVPNISGTLKVEYEHITLDKSIYDNLVNESTRLKKEIEFLRMAFDYYEPYEDE